MSNANYNALQSSAAIPRERRAAVRFFESWPDRLRRWTLGLAYALKAQRIRLLPRIWFMSLAQLFRPETEWNQLPAAPGHDDWRGLVGISDDLSVEALLANYKRGYFPFCHMGPMKWWCPAERAVIDPAETHVGKNLRRLLRQEKFHVTMDKRFAEVIEACAKPRSGKVPLTWITPRIKKAYYAAHEAGHAHSVEVWDEEGNLVGGLYGLAVGKVFFGESQFSHADHASKVALVALHRYLAQHGFKLRDAKWMTPHLASFGFHAISRDEFLKVLQKEANRPSEPGKWRADPDLVADAPKSEIKSDTPEKQKSSPEITA
ncbi:leucyl/phenylalanyl-tRNA--protein transferase [Methyloligella solikamskensis]|uniref:Leucyl/phenylalanyl-tRNA--protein transferase n=1 Tax=Methyloligella solikamskensis TaxID=1177756 RepID=A0ABW3J6Y1_9HYPH